MMGVMGMMRSIIPILLMIPINPIHVRAPVRRRRYFDGIKSSIESLSTLMFA